MFKKIKNLFKGKKAKEEVLENGIDLEDIKQEIEIEETKEETKEYQEDVVELDENITTEDEQSDIIEEIEDVVEEIEEVEEEIEEIEETEEIKEVVEKEIEIEEEIIIPIEVQKEEVDNYIVEEEIVEKKESFFKRLKSGLSKTRKGMTEKIDMVLSSYRKIDEELFEDLEEVLIMADIGVETTMKIIEAVKQKVREKKITEVGDIKGLIKEEMKEILSKGGSTSLNIESSPSIILVVGVNGAGKTTTIGKLSSRLKSEGKKVLIVAGDTFRAAAIEQLEEWSKRSQVDIISHQEGSDAAAVIFDGIQAAKARKIDVLICDTAGRLHNKKNLMNELNKIFRIVEREYPEAKKEVLLVVDATTGQNAILQAKTFKEACDITGIVLTKLDGTAKGGVVIGLQSEMQVPVKLVGVGEKLDDLQDFNADDFVNAIFEE